MKNRRPPAGKVPRRDPPPGVAAALRRWYEGKAPVLRFGAKFCALTLLFYLMLQTPFCKNVVLAFTVADARLSGMVLNLLGQHNHVETATLFSGSRPVISVISSCSGFDFLCIFSAAVLVFPVPFRKKIAGVLAGVPLLLALNLVRIMSLFCIGLHFPGAFDIMHEEIWAIILVAASIVIYIAWMRWAGSATLPSLDATA